MTPVRTIPCPGDAGGRQCGANLMRMPAIYLVQQDQVRRVRCPVCGKTIEVKLRVIQEPIIIEATAEEVESGT